MTAKSAPSKAQQSAHKGPVDICNNAVLIHVCISQWQARKLDKDTSGEVIKTKKAQDPEAAKVYKILINDPALDKWRTKSNALRGFVYRKTLPWLDGGTRIMPTKIYMETMADIQGQKIELDELLDEFLERYEVLRKKRERLGDLHDDSDFPNADNLRHRFGVNVTVLPVPAGNDWRVKGAEAPAHLQDLAKSADTENWKKIASTLHKMKTALGNESHPLRKNIGDRIVELCDTISTFNITENPEITAMCEQMKKDLGKLDKDVIKKDAKERKAAATKTKALHDKAAKFLKALDPNASAEGDEE